MPNTMSQVKLFKTIQHSHRSWGRWVDALKKWKQPYGELAPWVKNLPHYSACTGILSEHLLDYNSAGCFEVHNSNSLGHWVTAGSDRVTLDKSDHKVFTNKLKQKETQSFISAGSTVSQELTKTHFSCTDDLLRAACSLLIVINQSLYKVQALHWLVFFTSSRDALITLHCTPGAH